MVDVIVRIGKCHNGLSLQKFCFILERKIKVAAVSYLNTKPLLYGLNKHSIINNIELSLLYPALIAEGLISNTVDIGLVPVAALPDIPNAEIISQYGIAADGPVASVGIFSSKPIEHLESIYLDYQSRTSVLLAQLILKEWFNIQLDLLPAPHNYIDLIDGNKGAVVIGDRALMLRKKFPYFYDLAAIWKEMTGLPFVFAAWVSNKPISLSFKQKFDEANSYGLQKLNEVIAENPYSEYDLGTYYRKNIHYFLDNNKLKGLELFLAKIKVLQTKTILQ